MFYIQYQRCQKHNFENQVYFQISFSIVNLATVLI